ncbi:Uncharacterized protein TCM_040787 [Theobroma cacao]|uniref:Reverse transcriptase domain-containing protein n=1 Tax=Theobroma cacao TaxID=3641 RepID=A0A061GUC6_THECC|nr:Uncharacterized protein TCM_040787 [Theobroma cacao]
MGNDGEGMVRGWFRVSTIWNGIPTETFIPTRGIRQGDPLSPYLFVLCLETLSQLVNEEVSLGNWKPLVVTTRGPYLTHVCFADDLMLFGEASVKQVQTIMRVLDKFCLASGQKVSLEKSRMLVSSNVPLSKARVLSSDAKIPLTKDFGKYLGSPVIHGRVLKTTYTEVILKVKARLEH